MKPLNQPERRTRLWQFSLLYLLALLVPLGASYYLFSNSSIADENVRLKQELDRTHEEQALLVTRFDTLTQHLKRIDGIDTKIINETNPNERSRLTLKNQDNGNAIAVRLSELRNDTTQMQVPAHRLVARNVLRDFDFYRSTRNTIDALRQDVARYGDKDKGTDQLTKELDRTKQELNSSKQQVAVLLAGGGGRGGDNSPRTTPPPPPDQSMRAKLALLTDQLAFAEADCLRQRAISLKMRSRERRQLLEQSRTAFIHILQAPATDDLKQSIEKTLGPINVELGREPRFFGLL